MEAQHSGSGSSSAPSAALPPLMGAGLADLLHELLQRVDEIEADRQRLRLLLDAVVLLAADLSLEKVLDRIVELASELSGARYAALGVIGSDSERPLQAFVTHGLPESERGVIGEPPQGRGLLGSIVDEPGPLRLHDIATHTSAYGFPEGHPPMRTFLGVPVRLRGRMFGNLYLTEKRGGEDFTDSDAAVIEALAAAAGVVIENAQLYEEGIRRERWLTATAEVAGLLSSTRDFSYALEVVADRAREAADADLATIVLRSGPTELDVRVVSGAPRGSLPVDPMSLDGSLVGHVVSTGEVVVCPDVLADPRTEVRMAGLDDWPSIGPVVMVPMRSADGIEGALTLAWQRGREAAFATVDVRLPQQFAEQAALALHVARARATQEKLVVLEDRDRIGRDLHDLVIQRLFAVGLGLEKTARMVADRPEVSHRVAGAVDDLDETIKDIRRSIFALSAPRVSPDVRSTTRELVDRAARALKLRPDLTIVGPVGSVITPTVATHLAAVLGEALSNVVRHAEPTHVEVVLEAGDEVVLRVSDDGSGIPEDAPRSGLANLQQRAEALGGSCTVDSSPGRGTTITWRVPAR